MSPTMFIVGTVIFGVYMYFLIWNIFYSAKKQREENYPGLTSMEDPVDYDGMGNYGRFPSTVPNKRIRKKSKTKRKVKVN